MVGELREGYIAKWNEYPADEVKIRVARPSILAPSKELLAEFMDVKKSFVQLGVNEWVARKTTWRKVDYEKRFREEILDDRNAVAMLGYIIGLLDSGTNIRLICYEKKPPCHRFILIDIIREMMGQ